jgi:hypothetical protein
MDGVFKFDLAEGEDRWLLDVALGEHLLAAFKPSNGTQVASTTIKVSENKDCSWGISIIKGGRPVVIAGH